MLYKTDLKSYGLEKGSEITDEIWSRLKEEVLLKRAKLRAMHLLTDMARTEEQLRQKLRQNGYPEDVTEAAIAYVKSFGYINDENYVRNFIESRKAKTSICVLTEQEVRQEPYPFLMQLTQTQMWALSERKEQSPP